MSHHGIILYNTINLLGLCILNEGSPTHIGRPNSAGSAIDYWFCSPELFWNLSWCTLSEPHGSDHIPIIITVNNRLTSIHNSSNHHLSTNPINHDFNKANWISFLSIPKMQFPRQVRTLPQTIPTLFLQTFKITLQILLFRSKDPTTNLTYLSPLVELILFRGHQK